MTPTMPKTDCPTCEGNGIDWTVGFACAACDGSGHVRAAQPHTADAPAPQANQRADPWWTEVPWYQLNYYEQGDVQRWYQNRDPLHRAIDGDPRSSQKKSDAPTADPALSVDENAGTALTYEKPWDEQIRNAAARHILKSAVIPAANNEEESVEATSKDMGGACAKAAAVYALRSTSRQCVWWQFWPWPRESFRSRSPRHDLIKARALIDAEIARLDGTAANSAPSLDEVRRDEALLAAYNALTCLWPVLIAADDALPGIEGRRAAFKDARKKLVPLVDAIRAGKSNEPSITREEDAVRRANKAERALTGAGWTLSRDPETGAEAQEWRPPLGKQPDFNMLDAARLDGWRQAFEEAAKIVEDNQEADSNHIGKYLEPRMEGNLTALIYAKAIRAAAAADPMRAEGGER